VPPKRRSDGEPDLRPSQNPPIPLPQSSSRLPDADSEPALSELSPQHVDWNGQVRRTNLDDLAESGHLLFKENENAPIGQSRPNAIDAAVRPVRCDSLDRSRAAE